MRGGDRGGGGGQGRRGGGQGRRGGGRGAELYLNFLYLYKTNAYLKNCLKDKSLVFYNFF